MGNGPARRYGVDCFTCGFERSRRDRRARVSRRLFSGDCSRGESPIRPYYGGPEVPIPMSCPVFWSMI